MSRHLFLTQGFPLARGSTAHAYKEGSPLGISHVKLTEGAHRIFSGLTFLKSKMKIIRVEAEKYVGKRN